MAIGFNDSNINQGTSFYESFIGQPGHYSIGSINATGVLKEVNITERYLAIQPSLIGYGNSVRIETEHPTIITIEPGQPVVMRPLREGDLEIIVKENNKKGRKVIRKTGK